MTKWACFLATMFVAAGLAVAAGAAEVYVWLDANGVEHWSDRPPQPTKTGAESVKIVRPSFRNSSTPDVPWQREPDPPEPPPTRSQQEGKEQPASDTTDSAAQDAGAQGEGDSAEAKPPPTREEQLAEAREKREAAMRRRVAGEPPPKAEVPEQAEPEVPKPANLETVTSGYSGGWGL